MTALPAGSIAGTDLSGGLFSLRSDGRGGVSTTTLADPDGVQPVVLEGAPAAYVWPAWVPGQAAVIASTIEFPAPDRPPSQLLRIATDGGEGTVLYRSPAGSGLVGPDSPHYVNPSPDGKHLGVLAQAAPSGLVLLFVDGLGRGPVQPIARSAPLFSAWAPTSDALLLHSGGELSLMELASAPSMQVLASNHVNYRVPAWSPDGASIAVAAPAGANVAAQVIGRDGKARGALAAASGLIALSWSPDGQLLAIASGRQADPPLFSELTLLPVSPSAKGEGRRPRVADCLAFCWSPGGSYLAALVPDAREGRVAWAIIDRDGKTVQRFPGFRPSSEFSTYVAFFDQYSLSHKLWSPDGTAILGCGRMSHNGTPPELLPSRIYSFDVDSGDTLDVAAGGIAFWSGIAG